MKKLILLVVLACIAVSAYSQKKESLALLPFTGGQSEDGEYIVSEFARQRVLRDAFTKVTLITRTTQAFMRFEQKFQRDSGLTDADTIFELGKQLNAEYVIAGYITKLGTQNMVLVSILSVESLQLVAGDYRVYRNIEDVDAMIPEMARELAQSVGRDTSRLPGLSVPPFETANGVNESDAQVLAQILAISLANGTTYAVLPRTDSLEKVLDEHQRQRSGETDQERVRRLGEGRNALYVLAGSVGRLGSLTKFTADVLNIEDGAFIDGYSERYSAFSEGVDLIPKLAASLNGYESLSPTSSPPTPPLPEPTSTSKLAGFVQVPAGTFMMGSDKGESYEKPVHQVTISKAFYMSDHEVTQKEWYEVMGTTIQQESTKWGLSGSPTYGIGDNYPMYFVSWYEAVEYCNKRSTRDGLTPAYTIDTTRSDGNSTSKADNVKWVVTWNRNATGYRLPTEAEWEWAAKGGGKDPQIYEYSGSNDVDLVAWHWGNSGKTSHPVKTKAPNSLGLYDMSGNVWEWCWDWFGLYSSSAQTDPLGVAGGDGRVIRGGAYVSESQHTGSVIRLQNIPLRENFRIGFRLVRS